MSKLNWDNLKDVSCPKCSGKLANHSDNYFCESRDCEFRISNSRFDSLVDSLYE